MRKAKDKAMNSNICPLKKVLKLNYLRLNRTDTEFQANTSKFRCMHVSTWLLGLSYFVFIGTHCKVSAKRLNKTILMVA